jgi:PAS domain S-box-containing protein
MFQAVHEFVVEKYGEFVEALPDGIIITDVSGQIVLANSQVEELFGYGPGELVSQEVEVLVPKRYRTYHADLRNAYAADPDKRPMGQDVLQGLRRDGSEFPAEISLSPIHTEVGLLISSTVRDVTRQAQVTDDLRKSEERVRLVLDSTAEAIYGLDLEGNCTFCNRACLETLGYHTPEDLLGQNMHDLIHHTRPDGSAYPMHECKIYEACRRGKETHVDDEVLWKADGSSFPTEYRSLPIICDEELVGSVVTFLDITEKKRVAEALHMQQQELTHAARLSTLGEMAAGLAHELNQPLTAMLAFAEGALVRLERKNLRDSEAASVFKRIADDAQRAGDIIRRLRNFVQKRDAQRYQLDVNRLVHDVHKFVESDAKHESITLQFELGGGLPVIDADPIEIQQVLLNLIRNAHDALVQSDSDIRTIVISSCERVPDLVEIVVEDSGPGITNDMAERIFEPFYTTKADGLGIGLGICQNIIEAHGGKIWVGNSARGGASVHFNLPSNQQKDQPDEF